MINVYILIVAHIRVSCFMPEMIKLITCAVVRQEKLIQNLLRDVSLPRLRILYRSINIHITITMAHIFFADVVLA